MPSGGMESLLPNGEFWLWEKAGEPPEPFGVIVADMLDVLGAALWVPRFRRR